MNRYLRVALCRLGAQGLRQRETGKASTNLSADSAHLIRWDERHKQHQHEKRKPASIIARIWRGHTKWCPGWKVNQRAGRGQRLK